MDIFMADDIILYPLIVLYEVLLMTFNDLHDPVLYKLKL